MIFRPARVLLSLLACCVLSGPAGAADPAGSCAVSDLAAGAGWRLEHLATIPGEHHTAYAGFATIAVERTDWSYELWDVWTGARIRQLTPAASYRTQNSIRESSRDEERAIIQWHMAPATLVDMRTGQTLAELPTFYGNDIPCCAYFTEDNRWLVVSVPDGRHEIRNARTGALQGAFQLTPEAHDVAISPDGERLLAVDAATLQIIDTTAGAVIATTPRRAAHMGRLDARFSPNSERLVILNGWEWLYFDARTGARLADGGLTGGDGDFYLDFPEFLDGGAYVQFADSAGRRSILNARTGRTHIMLGPLAGEAAYAAEFAIRPSPDGRRFVARTPEGGASLWDVRSGRMLAHLGQYHVQSAFEPEPDEEEAIVIGGGRIGTSGEFVFTPDGQRLVSLDLQGELSLWDTHDGMRLRVLARLGGIDAHDIRLSESGSWIIAPTADDEVSVWSTRTGRRAVAIPNLYARSIRVLLSDDERHLAIADSASRQLWDLRAHRKVADLGEVGGRGGDAAFSRNSAYFLFNQVDDVGAERILVWGVTEGRVVAALGDFNFVSTHAIAAYQVAAGHAAYRRGRYTLWLLPSGDPILSCADGYTVLEQREEAQGVRLLRQADGEVTIWRLSPPV